MKITYKALKSLIREAVKPEPEEGEVNQPTMPTQPAAACQKCGKEHDLETSCLEHNVMESVGLNELDINGVAETGDETCDYCDLPKKKCNCFGAKNK